jgi:hypothetical protein
MTTSDLMGARFAQPAYRRVRLADEPAPQPWTARKLLRIGLALLGVALLVASAAAFAALVGQGWLDAPSAASLSAGATTAPAAEPGVVTKALLYPLGAVVSFVLSTIVSNRR